MSTELNAPPERHTLDWILGGNADPSLGERMPGQDTVPLSEPPKLELGSGGEAMPLSTGWRPFQPLTPRYCFLAHIGMGGMSDVLRVEDKVLERTAAMKVLRSDLAHDPLHAKRFLEEARATARLQHPGVVPIYDLGELEDSRPFFVMKEVEGRTLGDLITEMWPAGSPGGPLPGTQKLWRLITIFHQTCEAVGFAHTRRVIHLDLKPANIMVGGYGEVLVMDWGLARRFQPTAETGEGQGNASQASPAASGVARQNQSSEEHLVGTPGYIPPERVLQTTLPPHPGDCHP